MNICVAVYRCLCSYLKVEDIYRSLCCPRNGSDDLPFGLPTLVSSDLGIRNLTYMYHEDHVTLFDVDAGKVIWTMRTFLKSEVSIDY